MPFTLAATYFEWLSLCPSTEGPPVEPPEDRVAVSLILLLYSVPISPLLTCFLHYISLAATFVMFEAVKGFLQDTEIKQPL